MRDMNAKTQKVLKKVGIWILGIVIFLFIAVVAAVNLIMTNDRLMPLIDKYAHEYLDAEVSIGHAEGVLFKSFPYLGIKLDSVTIVTNAFQGGPVPYGDTSRVIVDSLRLRRDTLAKVDHAIVGINIAKYLLADDNSFTIGLISLECPKVRLVTDEHGHNGWDIMRPTEDDPSDTTSTDVKVKHIKIKDGRIAYFSKQDMMGVFVDSINFAADGEMGLNQVETDLDIDITRLSLGVKDNRYIRKMPLGLNGRLTYDNDSNKFNLSGLCLRVASADIDLDGWVKPDSAGALLDITYGLETPSAEKLFAAIPTSVISSPVDIKSGGVGLSGSVKGRLSETEIPLITGQAHLDKISAQYEGRPDEIEDLSAEFNMLVDQARPDSSYVNLDIFHFKGGKSEVSAIVKISQLLTEAMMDCNVKAHVDFDNLQRVIPFDNTNMSGTMDADIVTHFSLDDIRHRNYGRAKLDGSLSVSNLCITNDSSDLDIDVDASLKMKTDRVVSINSTLNSLKVKVGDITIGAKDGTLVAKSTFTQDTTAVVPVEGQIGIGRAFFKSDTVVVFAKNIRTDDRIAPDANNKHKPVINHQLNVDTLFAGVIGNRIFGHGFQITAHQEVKNDTAWHTTGSLSYSHAGVMPTFYSKPIKTDNFHLTLDGDSVNVNSVTVTSGNTALRASAYVCNLFTSLKQREQVTLNLKIDADTLDCNEIMASIVREKADSLSSLTAVNTTIGIDTTVTSATYTAIDTLKQPEDMMMRNTQLILIPRHIKLSVSTRAKRLKWSTLTMSDVIGEVRTKDGAAHVTNLSFKIGDARSISIMAYKAWPHAGKARANIFSRWERADIKLLSSALGLDTIIPALKPMSGKLDCYMAAEIELDSAMNVVTNTARAAIHLGGQKLTLTDNESFRKIGKKLMFKDKEKNVIDTLALNVLLDSGKVQVLPFVVNIDRYRLACAGEQDLDMNMKYHVSILKSPLPFKAGVNIIGTPDNFDVDITTAKLKKVVTAENMAKNDTTSLMLRMSVLRNSYILSGQPIPQYLRQIKGLDANPKFAIAIQEDTDTEESLHEAAMARRAAAGDSTATATPDTSAVRTESATTPKDSIIQKN